MADRSFSRGSNRQSSDISFSGVVLAAMAGEIMTQRSEIPHPSPKRIVHAIRFTIRGDIDSSFIVSPRDSGNLCVRLINSRRTWLHASAGDAVLLTRDGNTERQYIETVELYRVSPAEENGSLVPSAYEWLYES